MTGEEFEDWIDDEYQYSYWKDNKSENDYEDFDE